jgi:hypothetical protein
MSARDSGPVVVIGGSGAVGRSVARSLASMEGCELVVTARDASRARTVARGLGPTVTGIAVDTDDRAGVQRAVDGARVVVMCVERANARIAGTCLAQGIDYVDVSATDAVLDAIRRHHDGAVGSGATALLSVGVAPGLTNLLARLLRRELPTSSSIDLTLCFGLRGDAGPDSRRWVVDGLTARPAARAATVDLPGFGRRRAHWFPFSDQATIAAALDLAVTTRLCFESRAVTSAAFAARSAGLVALAGRLGGRGLLDRALGTVRFGTDRFLVHAQASDRAGTSMVASISGTGECRTTGRVTAAAVRHLLAGSVPTGVHDLDAVVDAESFMAELGDELRLRRPTLTAVRSPALVD